MPPTLTETPVLVAFWLDPPEQVDFAVGSAITMHAAFVDRITKQPVTPSTVTFSTFNPPITASPTTVTSTLDSTGVYHADIALPSPGSWVLAVSAQDSSSNGIGEARIMVQAIGGSF